MIRKKPWLDYKGALAEAKEVGRLRELKNKKLSYPWAIFWLIYLGPMGAHKFYVGDKKAGWIFFIIFMLLLVLLLYCDFRYGVIVQNLADTLLCVYWFAIFLLSINPLKRQIEQTNSEVAAEIRQITEEL